MTHNDTNPMYSMVHALARAPYLMAALILTTAGLLVWHHYGMDRTLELANGHVVVRTNDDRPTGGTSVASLTRDGNELVLDCKLTHVEKYPFCALVFELSRNTRGIDLTDYSDMTVEVGYKGPGPAVLRSTLINFEPEISRLDDYTSVKFNEIDNLAIGAFSSIRIPLRAFSVARWWIDLRKPPLSHFDTRIDNVIRVELVTPVGVLEGDHQLRVRSVRFHGKWLTQSELLLCLVALWILCAIAWPMLTARLLRDQLAASRSSLLLLRQVNEALQLEARELVSKAHHDPLTGVLNRQGLRAALMNTSSLLTDPMSVVFMDIDHFKRINDEHGHEIGDNVLRQFARHISSAIRTSDQLVRWGGEEFLIILPNTDVHQAAVLAEKLRCGLITQTWPAGLQVTSSFGIAQHLQCEKIGDVIKRADQQLYSAKAAGRNRVHADASTLMAS